jgi:hypothetical protein
MKSGLVAVKVAKKAVLERMDPTMRRTMDKQVGTVATMQH